MIKSFENMAVSRKLITFSTGLVIITATLIGFLQHNLIINSLEMFKDSLREKAKTVSANLASNATIAVSFDDEKTLNELVTEIIKDEDVLSVAVLNKKDEIISKAGSEDYLKYMYVFSKVNKAKDFQYDDYYWTVHPLISEEKVGFCIVGVTLKRVQEARNDLYIKGLPLMGLVVFIGMIISFYFSRRFVAPIKAITEVVKNIADEGKLSIEFQSHFKDDSGQVETNNEIIQLSRAFEKLVINIKSMTEKAKIIARGDLRNKALKERGEGDLEEAFAWMVQNLSILYEQAHAIADDNLDDEILDTQIEGELGKAFDEMVNNLRILSSEAEIIANDDLSNPLLDRRRDGSLGSAFAQMISKLRSLSIQANLIANGELHDNRIEEEGKGELGRSFTKMVEALKLIVTQANLIAQDKLQDELLSKTSMGEVGIVFKRMVKNLNDIQLLAKAVAEGDFDSDMLKKVESTGSLGSSLNEMVESLSILAKQAHSIASGKLNEEVLSRDISGTLGEAFRQMSDNLRTFLKSIQKSTKRIASASNEILVANEQMSEGAKTQSTQLEAVSSSVVELSTSIQQISQNALSAVKIAEQGETSATGGGGSVRATIQGMSEIREAVEDTAEQIKELGERGHEISKIVEAIVEIADQTNLLALNAAIEAARAGEQGRGFAVVADQVGKLAERSATSAKEISALIERIQKSTQETVKKMEDTISVVVSGSRLADESGAALTSIVDTVREMVNSVNEISTATSQQARVSDHVSENIESIASVSRQTAHGTEQAVVQARELLDITSDMEDAISKFDV